MLHSPLAALRATRDHIYSTRHVLGEDDSRHDVWPVGLTRERGEALRDLALAERAASIVETGFAYGMSASFLLEAALTTSPASAQLVSMDPFQSIHWKGAGVRHLRDAGLTKFHELLEAPSDAALPRLIADGRRFDLAFIDGDHRFESVFLDIHFARKLVGPGKLIIIDDAWMPSVQKAAAFFAGANLCRREETPAASPLAKFILLRVDAAGEARDWDHFAPF